MDLLKKLQLWWKTKATEEPPYDYLQPHDEINDVVSKEPADVVSKDPAAASLPEEIIGEILLRIASPKPLMRLKCVCKYWNSLIRDSKFAIMHLTHHHRRHHPSSSSLSIFVFHYKPMSITSCWSSEEAMFSVHSHDHDGGRLIQCYNVLPFANLHADRVVGSSNGLICLYFSLKSRKPNFDEQGLVYLWNPATRELQRLPPNDLCSNLRSRFSVFQFNNILFEFFYDPLMGDYKVLSVGQYNIEGNKFGYSVDMYSLASNSWRKIDDHADIIDFSAATPLVGFLRFSNMVYRHSSGVVNGQHLHWITEEHKNEMPPRWCIVRFDLKREVFDRIKPPPQLKTTSGQIELGNLYDCLTVLYNRNCMKTDIWVMKQYGVTASWTKLFNINHGIPMKIMGLETSGKLVTLNAKNRMVWYDLKSSNPSHPTEIRGQYDFCQVVSYVPTIIRIKAGKLHSG